MIWFIAWAITAALLLALMLFTTRVLRQKTALEKQMDETLGWLDKMKGEVADARRQAEGWRDLAVENGFGEGDNEDCLPWEPNYLQPPDYEADDA